MRDICNTWSWGGGESACVGLKDVAVGVHFGEISEGDLTLECVRVWALESHCWLCCLVFV